ncbi:hypothetical protein L1987_37763 [Smallanthus sonchifolius]|uniref:Uncharacterized protein n=1 Tax=Smallanthus sonchifolius TaxID=185202 RepID=A0ACB9HI62_9ASTR|nr:hypothetical protein L1987_37763 [Smallanthus sonchifolius]
MSCAFSTTVAAGEFVGRILKPSHTMARGHQKRSCSAGSQHGTTEEAVTGGCRTFTAASSTPFSVAGKAGQVSVVMSSPESATATIASRSALNNRPVLITRVPLRPPPPPWLLPSSFL